jgi:hypothetical protein
MIKLSIIIINYNGGEYLYKCLSSLYSSDQNLTFETIVVDNNSEDGSPAMIANNFPDAVLIRNSENLGFAKGNNIGISRSCGQYILLLNSDTVVLGNALKNLADYLDTHPDVAIVSPRLVYPDFTDQGVARTFPTPMNALFGRRTLLARLFPNNRYSKKYIVSQKDNSNNPFEVDWVSGACLMVRRSIIDEIGPLDDDFFMYWEDLEFCYRVKMKGWKVVCIPSETVIHYEGKSTLKKISSRCIIEFNRSAYLYYKKHHIKSPFEVMNLVAITGLTLRTLLLLLVNLFAVPRRDREEEALKGYR